MSSPPAFASHLEVERKFQPTASLKAYLHGNGKDLESFMLHNELPTPRSYYDQTLSFVRLPDKLICDAYFDLDGVLASKGIWVRNRTSRAVGNEDLPLVAVSKEVSNLEAKVRLAGDYADSQFLELEGESSIRDLLQQRVPETRLEGLKISADLKTHRKTWIIHETPKWQNAERKPEIRIDLDDVTTSIAPSNGYVGLKHEVGELEMTTEVIGGADEAEHMKTRLRVSADMHMALQEFMTRHKTLFTSTVKPKGKLEAYFDWQKNMSSS